DVLKTFDDWYERLEKRKRSDYLSIYINSITNVFDPHTSYFEPIEKQNFDINMSGKLEGIGARLQSDGNYTKITSVIVGGPAWKQGDLKENDKIMKVAQDGEDPIDVTGMQLDDVVSQIRGEKGTKVILTVKKIDGSIADIEIVRDVVILEEGFAKSLILHTTAKEKVGFISLPRFYDDFYDEEGRSCARDVATEIDKLKKENVRGIILDLRNNGGGSLRDVVTMSGFFIEKGPIVQVKARGRSPEVLEDNDPSVKWDGHLIVMVNQFSASASEILAAALQDYERAVIVGSTSTFGKGTVQRFYNLDRAIPGYSELKPFGEIKLTTQKFYRIDGGSTQLKGVTPDIILPDMYSYIETGEKEQEYPMNWTQIAPVPHEQNVR
ncbi:MAG: S41 family peptidase, partial [Bacteroidota bacterium]